MDKGCIGVKKFPIYVLTVAGIIILFFFYSLCILKYSIKVDETIIKNPNIPATFDGVRIIQFSDTLIENEEDLDIFKKAIDEINQLNPDIVLFTGGLFKNETISSSLLTEVSNLLLTIKSPLAKVAVLGDEDIINEQGITELLTNANFKVLKNEVLPLYNGSSESISLIGFNSLTTNPPLSSILSEHSDSTTFNLALIHEPTLASVVTDYPVELQLSGHCRGIMKTDESKPNYCQQFYNGTYRFADRLTLHVNQGINRSNHAAALLTRPTLQSFLLIKEQ